MWQLVLEGITIVSYGETTRVFNQLDLSLDNVLLCRSLTDFRHKLVLRCLIDVLIVVFTDLHASEHQTHCSRWGRCANAQIYRAIWMERLLKSHPVNDRVSQPTLLTRIRCHLQHTRLYQSVQPTRSPLLIWPMQWWVGLVYLTWTVHACMHIAQA